MISAASMNVSRTGYMGMLVAGTISPPAHCSFCTMDGREPLRDSCMEIFKGDDWHDSSDTAHQLSGSTSGATPASNPGWGSSASNPTTDAARHCCRQKPASDLSVAAAHLRCLPTFSSSSPEPGWSALPPASSAVTAAGAAALRIAPSNASPTTAHRPLTHHTNPSHTHPHY